MDLRLKRSSFGLHGVFGSLFDSNGNLICVTLEHAYPNSDGKFFTKIPMIGQFTCVRGIHYPDGITKETFEVTGVQGHSGILFHSGNYNADSDGCILLGLSIGLLNNEPTLITHSKEAFAKFFALETGVDRFQLTVSS